MIDKYKPKRTTIEDIKVSGHTLSDEQLRLVAGAMIKKPTYLYTRGPIDVYQD